MLCRPFVPLSFSFCLYISALLNEISVTRRLIPPSSRHNWAGPPNICMHFAPLCSSFCSRSQLPASSSLFFPPQKYWRLRLSGVPLNPADRHRKHAAPPSEAPRTSLSSAVSRSPRSTGYASPPSASPNSLTFVEEPQGSFAHNGLHGVLGAHQPETGGPPYPVRTSAASPLVFRGSVTNSLQEAGTTAPRLPLRGGDPLRQLQR
ncbi:hypothetical protein cyc_06428 [Cyclospora cayetanensis]|uniref:Uncharacterized protein n=1 Tax=Cyclospora cayetanensis TaxID=88456 RepID=A0A1D3CUE8_9EIME|nr:hypothetical protein cyc_06428 [Cyclospora cayetanensis]